VGFQDFLGNTQTVTHLRESIRAGRFPHSLILAGPRGAGKYTLALMLAKWSTASIKLNPTAFPTSVALLQLPPHRRFRQPEEPVAEAIEAREGPARNRQARNPHPHPDPPRRADSSARPAAAPHQARAGPPGHPRRVLPPPVESRRTFTIFTSSAFMKEAANSLLKVLEEPPEHTSLILLTENPQELLPTIRSRAVVHRLGALAAADLESLLACAAPSSSRRTAPWPHAWPKARLAARLPSTSAYLSQPTGSAHPAPHRAAGT
jgi:DNA polymerase III subunit delta'